MSAPDIEMTIAEYNFRETVFDVVQSKHEELLGKDSVGVVVADMQQLRWFFIECAGIDDARNYTMVSSESQTYIVGADVRE